EELVRDLARLEEPDPRVLDELTNFAEVRGRVRLVEHVPGFLAELPPAVLKHDRRTAPQHLLDVAGGEVTEHAEHKQGDVAPQDRSMGLGNFFNETHGAPLVVE